MEHEPNKVIFSVVSVGKIHGTKHVLKDISLSFFHGAKIGVIGLNGSGKSSLLRIMSGGDDEHLGERIISPGVSVGFLAQEPQLDKDKCVIDCVREGARETVELLEEFESINEKFADPELSEEGMNSLLERQGLVQDKLDTLDAWDLDSRLQLAMDALRCPEPDTSIALLSGGELRRVALCRLLIQQPDVLLLDEPTNHLDTGSVHWLEQHIQRYPGTVVAVTHDR